MAKNKLALTYDEIQECTEDEKWLIDYLVENKLLEMDEDGQLFITSEDGKIYLPEKPREDHGRFPWEN